MVNDAGWKLILRLVKLGRGEQVNSKISPGKLV